MNYLQIYPVFRIIFLSGILLLGIACSPPLNKPPDILAAEVNLPETIDFNFHVKPILSDRCFACHGPDNGKREAGLRLDQAIAAMEELPETPGKYAIVSSKPNRSELVHRILSKDPDLQMPPPDSKLHVTAEEKAILIKWIEQGAEYQEHWAYLPVKEEKEASAADIHPIDYFVQQELKKRDLSPAPSANKETLIRRLSFDLTGLPPSLEQINAFVEDESEGSYEQLVDDLLASKAYGERMAAHWLDVARYADSDGYLDDKHRDFSPWREWVIHAFNENLPYDDFVTWQVAGDLLPNPTQEQILATAFNRLHKKNSEAGIVFEEYRVEYVADRTNTFGKAFLGLSLECARCHDHKFDPISQKEYYQLFGFFNSTNEWGHPVYGPDQTPGPALLLTDEQSRNQIQFLHALADKQEQDIAGIQAQSQEAFNTWRQSFDPSTEAFQLKIDQACVSHLAFDRIQQENPVKASTPDLANPSASASLNQVKTAKGIKGKAFEVTDYNSGTFPEKVGWYERTEAFSIDLWLLPDSIYREASIFTHCEDRRLGLKGYSFHLRDNRPVFIMAHSWPQNAMQVIADQPLAPKTWSHITLTYDGSSQADGVKIFLNGVPMNLETEVDHLYKGILFEKNIHTYGFSGLTFGYRNKMLPFKRGRLDEFRVFNRALTGWEVLFLHEGGTALSNPSEKQLKAYFFARVHPESQQLQQKKQDYLQQLTTLVNDIPEIMIMGDSTVPRPTYILNRGNYEQRGEEVQPNTPDFLPPLPEGSERNRLALAQWLFAPDHPLTARVIVNRIWQLHFGTGIVPTSEDFGSQGALPSHPALLDWLAAWLVESDWNLKALHKLIVMSKTYQQSSASSPDALEADPKNVWLARGPSFRLPAEMIRDNALAISGLLIHKVGGESVYPYQPEGLWDELSNKSWRYPYKQEPGEGLYRRSIYSIWKRTSPPPSMQIFDIADRDNCTVRRRNTSTPLQALVLLNDPQFQEAARVAAQGILKQEDRKEAPLQMAFRLATGRKASTQELDRIKQFWEKEKSYYQQHPEEALAYLQIGETAWDRSLPPAELASLGVTVNSLMNTYEGYTRK